MSQIEGLSQRDETMKIIEYLHKLTDQMGEMKVEVRLLRNDYTNEIKHLEGNHATINASLSKLDERIEKMAKRMDIYDKRFDQMDALTKYKGSILHAVSTNWWKILAVLAPLMVAMWELGIFLRNLPVT